MNTITWRWTEEDWKVWYRSYVESATYRDQCRQVKTVGAVVGVCNPGVFLDSLAAAKTGIAPAGRR